MSTEPSDVPAKGEEKRGRWHKLTGALLAVTGFFWLAHKLGWMPAHDGGPAIFWPVVLMAVGAFMSAHAGRGRDRHGA